LTHRSDLHFPIKKLEYFLKINILAFIIRNYISKFVLTVIFFKEDDIKKFFVGTGDVALPVNLSNGHAAHVIFY
jgi:hypothetical protein